MFSGFMFYKKMENENYIFDVFVFFLLEDIMGSVQQYMEIDEVGWQ